MEWIGFFILIFTALRLTVVLVNLFTRQWLQPGFTNQKPKVSVLIPARDEEKNVSQLMDSLTTHDYQNTEILIYDDNSTDNTWKILKDWEAKYPNIKAVKGDILPQGWLGKNHACHKLALQARGDYLLFLDADVDIKVGLMVNAMAHVQKYNLQLLSLFPTQKMVTFSEKLTVPLMNWILLSLLPLIFTRISSHPSLAAANGQFMLFDAETYRKEQFHEKFKNQKVEDIIIFRYMKQKGYRVHTLLGNQQIYCRMYDSMTASVQGFSKNVFEFFGGSKLLAFIFGVLTTFGFLAVWIALPLVYTGIYLIMILLLRALIAVMSKQNIFTSLVLAPLQQIAFLFILIKATLLQHKKATLWKGRNIDR